MVIVMRDLASLIPETRRLRAHFVLWIGMTRDILEHNSQPAAGCWLLVVMNALVTTNLTFSEWGKLLTDEKITTAMQTGLSITARLSRQETTVTASSRG